MKRAIVAETEGMRPGRDPLWVELRKISDRRIRRIFRVYTLIFSPLSAARRFRPGVVSYRLWNWNVVCTQTQTARVAALFELDWGPQDAFAQTKGSRIHMSTATELSGNVLQGLIEGTRRILLDRDTPIADQIDAISVEFDGAAKPCYWLEFSKVETVNSAELSSLIRFSLQVRQHEGSVFVSHVGTELQEIFEITRFDRYCQRLAVTEESLPVATVRRSAK